MYNFPKALETPGNLSRVIKDSVNPAISVSISFFVVESITFCKPDASNDSFSSLAMFSDDILLCLKISGISSSSFFISSCN